MNVCLTLVEGGKSVAIRPKLPTIIGRNTEADVQVPDSQVSRRHCELYEYEGQLAVRDVGSVNGTMVNGHKIEQDTFLSTGDTLGIGRVTFHVEVGAEGSSPTASESGVVAVEDESVAEPAQGESAVLNYEQSDEGSFIGIAQSDVPTEPAPEPVATSEDEDDDEDGLADFLKGLN